VNELNNHLPQNVWKTFNGTDPDASANSLKHAYIVKLYEHSTTLHSQSRVKQTS